MGKPQVEGGEGMLGRCREPRGQSPIASMEGGLSAGMVREDVRMAKVVRGAWVPGAFSKAVLPECHLWALCRP